MPGTQTPAKVAIYSQVSYIPKLASPHYETGFSVDNGDSKRKHSKTRCTMGSWGKKHKITSSG
jgi:hypothetical protein